MSCLRSCIPPCVFGSFSFGLKKGAAFVVFPAGRGGFPCRRRALRPSRSRRLYRNPSAPVPPAMRSMAWAVVSPSALSVSTAVKAGPRDENSATDQASSTRRATRQPSGPCSTISAKRPSAVVRLLSARSMPGSQWMRFSRLQELDRFVLLGEEDHPVRVLPGGPRRRVGVVVVDRLRAGDQRAPVFAGTARRAFEERLAVLAREQVPGLVDDDRLRPRARAVIHALGSPGRPPASAPRPGRRRGP